MSNTVDVEYSGEILARGGTCPRSLWPHQQDAIRAMNGKIPLDSTQIPQRPAFAGLLVVPTGGGKTLIAVRWLLRNIIDGKRKKKVLWIAHRHELLKQAFSAFETNAYSDVMYPDTKSFRFRIISGLDDKPVNIDANDDIIIASKDSLNKGLTYLTREWLASGDEVFLVVDEAHHATAKTYRKIIDTLNDGKRVFRIIGLTATPFRTLEKEKGLLGRVFTNDIIYRVDLKTLIARGISRHSGETSQQLRRPARTCATLTLLSC
ncbi:MAG: DEAD/DEAH box helicase [Desulfomonilaceae bacterium]